MKNTFEAYECTLLLKKGAQIESIAAYDDILLIGTKEGHLIIYSVTRRCSDNKLEVHLQCYIKTFGKKTVQQLAVVPEHKLLISLTDGVSVHDLAGVNRPPLCSLPETKGASLFSVNVQRTVSTSGVVNAIVRLCVAVKKKLLLFYWKKGAFLSLQEEEISIPDNPKSMAWIDDTICVGFKGDSGYIMYHLNRQKKEESQKFLFRAGNCSSTVLSMNDEKFILGQDNQCTFVGKNGDPATLKSIIWNSAPKELVYDEPYLIALFPEKLEVRSLEPSVCVQTQSLAQKESPLKENPRLIIRCRSGLLYVAVDSYVWCLQNISWSRQIHFLLEEKQFQLAIQIANVSDENLEDKSKTVHQIQTLYAYYLFNQRKFKESMEQFLLLETDPYEVIKLFPFLLPQKSRLKAQTEAVIKLEDTDLEMGLQALIDYLIKVRLAKKTEKEKEDKKHTEREEKRRQGKISDEEEVLEKEYEKFRIATEQLFQIIDTTLLKCYLQQTNYALVAPLLRLNHCNFEEAEKMLKKYEKHSELIILYETKGHHKKALELLQKQSTQNNSDSFGHHKTILYLQNLGKDHIDLILEYAGLVLEEHPMGLSIFTEDIPEVKSLPRPKVADFLFKHHKRLVIPYLEHVIHEWRDNSTTLHDTLVHEYKEEASMLLKSGSKAEEKEARAKLLNFLETSNHYNPEKALVQFPYDSMFEERAAILGKLKKHEQVLSIYVMMLGDVQRAIHYCNEVYNSNREGADEVFGLLIKMLISPPDSWIKGVSVSPATSKPDLETALSLLEEHASKIQPLQVLELLPDTVHLGRIRHFLEQSLKKHLNERRRILFLKGLTYAENLKFHKKRMQYESRSIKITEIDVCADCKRRFGDQSAIALFPDGKIVHLACHNGKTPQRIP